MFSVCVHWMSGNICLRSSLASSFQIETGFVSDASLSFFYPVTYCSIRAHWRLYLIRRELRSCAPFRAVFVFLLWQSGPSAAPPQADPCTSSATSSSTASKTEQKKLLSKDSILSLYASSPVGSQSQQQPAAGQGDTHAHTSKWYLR